MSDAQVALLAALLAPLVVVALVAMVRGYHLTVKLFRPRKEEGKPDGPADS